ncbi:PEP-CTERM sorting domain-containing protein [Scytonema sp. NUACC26]|uniref:PEP-CTERM sorting domain-containing protein n=1 Tax=Scytonema sp. NUACC26 TaxID=3140176 RepID=UPI0034DC5DD7
MNCLCQKAVIATAGVILSFAAIEAKTIDTARATTVTYNFNVDMTYGPLSGQSYSGNFSYDDVSSKQSDGTYKVTSGIFNYASSSTGGLPSQYSLTGLTFFDRSTPGMEDRFGLENFFYPPRILYSNPASDPYAKGFFFRFGFNLGSFPFPAMFYDEGYFGSGSPIFNFGKVTYTRSVAVPEPTTVLGLLLLATLGLWKSVRSSRHSFKGACMK